MRMPARGEDGGHEVDVGHHLLVPLRPQHGLDRLCREQLQRSTFLLK